MGVCGGQQPNVLMPATSEDLPEHNKKQGHTPSSLPGCLLVSPLEVPTTSATSSGMAVHVDADRDQYNSSSLGNSAQTPAHTRQWPGRLPPCVQASPGAAYSSPAPAAARGSLAITPNMAGHTPLGKASGNDQHPQKLQAKRKCPRWHAIPVAEAEARARARAQSVTASVCSSFPQHLIKAWATGACRYY